MAAHTKAIVAIPGDAGVHVKTAGAKGEKYVYKYVKYFRNAEGKPRNQAVAIGKWAGEGKMAPNWRYGEMYGVDPAIPEAGVWDYGYSYLALKASRDMGLLGSLEAAFGERRALDMVVMASYIIREGSAMDGIDDWRQRNYFPGSGRSLTSQSTSKIFAGLSARPINDFFSGWVEKTIGEGVVCYDVTSISSYARQMPSVERGYNRDGEDLAQFNLGMFCDEASGIPIYYNRYNGSLTDKTNLSCALANAEAVGIKRVKLVVDGGFMAKGCLTDLAGMCEAFTVGMPTYLRESRKILETHGGSVENYANSLKPAHMFCMAVDCELHGVSGKAMLYFDALSHVWLCDELSENINRLKAELSALKRYPKNNLKRYEPYFSIVKHEQGPGFDYKVNVEEVEKARKSKGYFLIFTTDAESTPDEVLHHYRAKDVAEKMFDQIKCDMDGNRARTHSGQTTDGKVFVVFLACVIRSYFLRKLERYLTENSTSLKKAFSQLSNIVVISGPQGMRFAKALTKKQKEILKPFGADLDIVASLNDLSTLISRGI